ncbi:glycosyltransferase family 2 protein [Endozoicomonas ascidiicola]|uniref:glycosyltransferase family 2 protein n=1 Tax=Endozoicomonas ascidiicola TaxID=1698521 RepID=UPI000834C822|nr:glycosyltransferase [Endozoicomonas ascidiicola]
MYNVFSDSSNVTLVLTSCGRFDLLKKTLESFLQYNTYPIKSVIITEDSGDRTVFEYIPEVMKSKAEVIVNSPKLGQIKSIDLAYSKVETEYVFHCEDDWEFYRPGFIEDSIRIMEGDSNILQVWLRSFQHDIMVHSPYHFLGERKLLDGLAYYQVGSNKKDWQGFSFNPGIKRISDYQKIGTYSSFSSEKGISKHCAELGFYAVILENDAIMHIGFDSHVEGMREKSKKRRRRFKDSFKQALIFLGGFLLGWLL